METEKKLSLLIIDDVEELFPVYKHLLKDQNLTLHFANSGANGLKSIEQYKPEIIFLDISLPDMSGIDVSNEISKKYSFGSYYPDIFAFTGYRYNDESIFSKGTRIIRVIHKSNSPEILKVQMKEAIAESVARKKTQISPRSKQVLLIEDNLSDIQLFKLLLKRTNTEIDVKAIEDGEDALNYLFEILKADEQLLPDMIFLDLNIPKKNGFEVLKEIKTDAKLRSIPTIILSTSKNKTDITECYKNHANCYLTKPSDLTEFQKMIIRIDEFWLKSVKLPLSSQVFGGI